jgi:thiol-disulfide isomerase/thioredoxin
MRSFISSLVLFASFAIVFSGCSGSSAEKAASNNTNASNANANATGPIEKTEEEKKKSPHYRPIEKSIDQADLKNLDGSVFKVADKRGKVVLLNLWATWCGPCRAEMPTLVKMQDAHREKGLEIIGLNTDDETVESINKFAADMKLNYTLVWADTAMQSALVGISKFGGIPQSFIIDRDGNLRGVFRGANTADVKKMEELVELIVNE